MAADMKTRIARNLKRQLQAITDTEREIEQVQKMGPLGEKLLANLQQKLERQKTNAEETRANLELLTTVPDAPPAAPPIVQQPEPDLNIDPPKKRK